jgi:hypothetical protein
MGFVKARNRAIRAEQPGLSFAEYGRMMGEEWAALSPAAKAEYGRATFACTFACVPQESQ